MFTSHHLFTTVLIFSFWKYRNASRTFTISGEASLWENGVYNKNSN